MATHESKAPIPMFCAGCMTAISNTSHPSRCANAACRWEEVKQPERQEHLPRHYLLFNRYYIGRVLGQGGFGITYLALDTELDRQIAIKEYLPREHCSRLTDRVTVRSHGGEKADFFSTGLQGFLNEAKNIARLDGHPNIVSITDHVKANGTAYMVMQFVHGKTLKEFLAEQGGRIRYEMARDIMLHVMSGLRKAHQHGVLHRDISPDNIMVSSQGPVKIIDFGAARQASGELARGMTVILKPGYAPEEQYRTRGRQGPWTDVYAVAATLYRCITGEPPPDAPDRLADDELVRPTDFCPDLPPWVEAAIMKGLAVRAADRFQSMDEFQEALLSRADLKPVQAPERKSSVTNQSSKERSAEKSRQPIPESPAIRPPEPPKQKASEQPLEKAPVEPAANNPPPKPWFLAPATLAVFGVLVVAALGLAIYRYSTPPSAAKNLAAPTTIAPNEVQVVWGNLPYNDPALSNCGGIQRCLDRKAMADALMAVRDWTALGFDNVLFADCMNYQPCMDRNRHRTALSSVKSWEAVAKNDAILQDCMQFGPCVERSHATVLQKGKTPKPDRPPSEEQLEQFGNYANCKDSPNPAKCLEYKKREGPVYGPSK